MSATAQEQLRTLALRFDGTQALRPTGDGPEGSWYTPRPKAVAEEIVAELDRADRRRIVLYGQPGIGKTTELNFAAWSIVPRGFRTIHVQIEQLADLNLLGWADLAVLCVLWLVYGVRKESERRELPPFESESLNQLLAALGFDGIPDAGGVFRYSHPAIRDAIGKQPQQVMDLCQQTVNHMSAFLRRRIVAVVDGTDRMSMGRARAMLFREGQQVYEFPCSLAIVLPLDIQFEGWYAQVEEHFHEKVRMRGISPDSDEGVLFFSALLQRRLQEDCGPEDLFNPSGLLGDFIRYGGGVPRQFLSLVAYALRVAELEGRPNVDRYCLDRAVEKARERFVYALSNDALLKKFTQFERGQQPQNLDVLLRLGAIIEFESPGQPIPRREANPLCKAILRDYEKRMGIGS